MNDPDFSFELLTQDENARLGIISTPKGVMTDIDARKQKVGGEIICKVF